MQELKPFLQKLKPFLQKLKLFLPDIIAASEPRPPLEPFELLELLELSFLEGAFFLEGAKMAGEAILRIKGEKDYYQYDFEKHDCIAKQIIELTERERQF